MKLYFPSLESFVATILIVVPMLWGCSNSKLMSQGEVSDRETTASLVSTKISTVISDSGITRYRINTDEMLVYDKAERSHWLFPQGLHFERFDSVYNVDARIDCRWAKYYYLEKLWVLKDSVRCTNVGGEVFETNMLNWDEVTQKIYSDSSISITRKTMIINGVGFESNQMLTRYHINKVTGILPIDNE